MAAQLPLLMQHLFNRPLAVSEKHATMIVAALSGRLDIAQLTTETAAFDRQALATIASDGRRQVSAERQLRAQQLSAGPEGPMIVPVEDWSELAQMRGKPYQLTSEGIAVIDIQGTLTRTWGCDPYSGSTGYDGIWTKLAYALDDSACRGIWLKVNSPGGSTDGLFDLADAIASVRQKAGGKPIWAYAGDYAYSAAHTLASAADRFIASPLGGAGSIGVLAIAIDYTAMMEAEGVKARIFRSADRKAIGIGGMEPLDKEAIDDLQAMVDETGDYLNERIAEYRGVSKSTISETRGNSYTASQAKAIGLIDATLREQDAWSEFRRAIAA